MIELPLLNVKMLTRDYCHNSVISGDQSHESVVVSLVDRLSTCFLTSTDWNFMSFI